MIRSGLSKKLQINNGVGIVDIDYRDEIKIRLHNPSQDTERVYIKKGDRIAQITLLEHKSEIMNMHSDDVRTGGFGSTDKKD